MVNVVMFSTFSKNRTLFSTNGMGSSTLHYLCSQYLCHDIDQKIVIPNCPLVNLGVIQRMIDHYVWQVGFVVILGH